MNITILPVILQIYWFIIQNNMQITLILLRYYSFFIYLNIKSIIPLKTYTIYCMPSLQHYIKIVVAVSDINI